MKNLLYAVSLLALLTTIGAPLLFLNRQVDEGTMKLLLLGATACWFIAWPLATRSLRQDSSLTHDDGTSDEAEA